MQSTLISFCVALGIGLLVGAERERRKSSSPDRSAAGIRTFAITSILGAVAMLLGGIALLGVAVLITAGAALVAYRGNPKLDPGLTTEMALVLICLLGGLAVQHALLAAGVGVLLALLLVARTWFHHVVRNLLTEQDLQDAFIFAAMVLIVMPLAPDQFMGPFNALNPRSLVTLVVAVMAISAAGYAGSRWLGPRYGLPLAGFAAGFVSSTATIHAMGQRVKVNAALMRPAVAGAVLSSIATIVQMSLLIGLVQPALLRLMAWPLTAGGVAATLYGVVYLVRGSKDAASAAAEPETGRAFSVTASLAFAAVLACFVTVAAGLNAALGEQGLVLGALVSGLADAHATAASAASLLASGKIQAAQAVVPILLGLTANTLTKAVVAWNSGGAVYARQIIPGLVGMSLAVWGGYWVVTG